MKEDYQDRKCVDCEHFKDYKCGECNIVKCCECRFCLFQPKENTNE